MQTGVNLQENQALMINAPIEGADFTRIVARKAYEMGAKDVHINWSDDELTLLKYENAPDEVIGSFPEWKVKLNESYAEDGAAVLSIRSTNPDLLKDIDSSRVAMANKAAAQAMKNFRQYTMNDRITWSIISIPTGDWAQKIFPDKSRGDAVESLWDAIVKIVRVDKDDPVAAWEEHNKTLETAREILNRKNTKNSNSRHLVQIWTWNCLKDTSGKAAPLCLSKAFALIRTCQRKRSFPCRTNMVLMVPYQARNR